MISTLPKLFLLFAACMAHTNISLASKIAPAIECQKPVNKIYLFQQQNCLNEKYKQAGLSNKKQRAFLHKTCKKLHADLHGLYEDNNVIMPKYVAMIIVNALPIINWNKKSISHLQDIKVTPFFLSIMDIATKQKAKHVELFILETINCLLDISQQNQKQQSYKKHKKRRARREFAADVADDLADYLDNALATHKDNGEEAHEENDDDARSSASAMTDESSAMQTLFVNSDYSGYIELFDYSYEYEAEGYESDTENDWSYSYYSV